MVLHFVGIHVVDVVNEWEVLQLRKLKGARADIEGEEVRRIAGDVFADLCFGSKVASEVNSPLSRIRLIRSFLAWLVRRLFYCRPLETF